MLQLTNPLKAGVISTTTAPFFYTTLLFSSSHLLSQYVFRGLPFRFTVGASLSHYLPRKLLRFTNVVSLIFSTITLAVRSVLWGVLQSFIRTDSNLEHPAITSTSILHVDTYHSISFCPILVLWKKLSQDNRDIMA